MFSESPDPAQWPHVATGLTYRRAMRELAAFLGCEPGEDGVYAHRLAADFDDVLGRACCGRRARACS